MLAPWKKSHDQPAAAAKSVPSCPHVLLSVVSLLEAPWTAAHQAPPPMGFSSKRTDWSGVPLPSPLLLLDCAYSANTEDLFCARRCCRHGKYGSM